MTRNPRITRLVFLATAGSLAVACAPWNSRGGAAGFVATTLLSVVFAVAGPKLGRTARRLWLFAATEATREIETLRQHVPHPITNRVARRSRPDCGEREVSVMFVDLRGYTTLAEDLLPEELFFLIDRYTRAVEQVVRVYGGFAAEFNGDGLMALFGAPTNGIGKERAALKAAQSLIDKVATIEIGPARYSSRHLRVGIGIATGRAFVGRIRAADRCVWAAVGTTTNLASRLQALSRDFDASIVIDGATRDAAGFDPGLVSFPSTRIRGLRDPVDVYVLPREERSGAVDSLSSRVVPARWASLGGSAAPGFDRLGRSGSASFMGAPQASSSHGSARI